MSGETASSIGTIGCITACTVVVSIGVTAIGKITITITTAITGKRCRRAPYVVVEHGEAVKEVVLPLMKLQVRAVVVRKSGGAAAERGARGATCEAKAGCAVAAAMVSDQRKRAAPPKRRGP